MKKLTFLVEVEAKNIFRKDSLDIYIRKICPIRTIHSTFVHKALLDLLAIGIVWFYLL